MKNSVLISEKFKNTIIIRIGMLDERGEKNESMEKQS